MELRKASVQAPCAVGSEDARPAKPLSNVLKPALFIYSFIYVYICILVVWLYDIYFVLILSVFAEAKSSRSRLGDRGR